MADSILELGESGQKLPYQDFRRAQELAAKFHSKNLAASSLSAALGEKLEPDPGVISRCFRQGLIGTDPHLVNVVMPDIQLCAEHDGNVLIMGQTGSGKELVARCIHCLGPRSKLPFQDVNCSWFSRDLLVSALFGHDKGAFTGATSSKKGLVETAEDGTLFLDEIGEMPLDTQPQLLRFLETGEYNRLGGTQTQTSKVRIIAATNRGMENALSTGRFRDDLYHRRASSEIEMRPLFFRPGDLPMLIYYFVALFNAKSGSQKVTKISQNALFEAGIHDWHGNVRELRNRVKQACMQSVRRENLSDTLLTLNTWDDLEVRHWEFISQMEEIPGGQLPSYDFHKLMLQMADNYRSDGISPIPPVTVEQRSRRGTFDGSHQFPPRRSDLVEEIIGQKLTVKDVERAPFQE